MAMSKGSIDREITSIEKIEQNQNVIIIIEGLTQDNMFDIPYFHI